MKLVLPLLKLVGLMLAVGEMPNNDELRLDGVVTITDELVGLATL